MTEKHNKYISPPAPDFVSYYYHSAFASISFTINIENNEVKSVMRMECMTNNHGKWHVNDQPGNCTASEFDEMLLKAQEFIRKAAKISTDGL